MNEPDITRRQHEVSNPEVTYDPTDLSARAVIMFLIFLAVAGILVQTALWGFYKYIAAERYTPHPTTAPIGTSSQQLSEVGGDPAVRFPAPRLQPDPVADLNKFRIREEQVLNTYGWEDQANNKVHIPVERAIDLTAAVGLPVRTPTTAAAPPSNRAPSFHGATAGINFKQGQGKPPQAKRTSQEQQQ